jgi:hypothetical protein
MTSDSAFESGRLQVGRLFAEFAGFAFAGGAARVMLGAISMTAAAMTTMSRRTGIRVPLLCVGTAGCAARRGQIANSALLAQTPPGQRK